MAERINLTNYCTEVRLAAHAVGLDHKKPYRRHSQMFYKPYRNHFTTAPGGNGYREWMRLAKLGYAGYGVSKVSCSGMTGVSCRFWLTREGLNWLGYTLHITIHNEEE